MGYSGGTTASPTYRSIGDHTETIQIDFDPSKISYEKLLDSALEQGNFEGRQWSKQYRSAVFYHNKKQLDIARERGVKLLEPVGKFTRAEDYHQKYYLQQSNVAKDFYTRYPTARAFTDATATARANAVFGGHVDRERLQGLIPKLGVSKASAESMLKMAPASPAGCAVPSSGL